MSGTPLTSAGLSGSAGSAATRSHSTRSADCACRAGAGMAASATTAMQCEQITRHPHGRRGCVEGPANSRLQPGLPQHRRDLRRSQIAAAAGLPDRRSAMPPCGRRKTPPAFAARAESVRSPRCRDLLQLADLLDGEIGLAADEPFGGKARRNDHGAGVDLGRDPQSLDQLREQDAAGADAANRPPTRAPSSVARSAASVAMSGWVAPAFTAMPT